VDNFFLFFIYHEFTHNLGVDNPVDNYVDRMWITFYPQTYPQTYPQKRATYPQLVIFSNCGKLRNFKSG
jgi:hypothetical protein